MQVRFYFCPPFIYIVQARANMRKYNKKPFEGTLRNEELLCHSTGWLHLTLLKNDHDNSDYLSMSLSYMSDAIYWLQISEFLSMYRKTTKLVSYNIICDLLQALLSTIERSKRKGVKLRIYTMLHLCERKVKEVIEIIWDSDH